MNAQGFHFNGVGADGAGKNTAVDRYILEKAPRAATYREPGGTEEGEQIRLILLQPDLSAADAAKILDRLLVRGSKATAVCKESLEQARVEILARGVNAKAEVYLFAASRAQSNRTVVAPAKKAGKLIVGMRSVACSMAYQASARASELLADGVEDPVGFVWSANLKAIEGYHPDLEIWFDVPVETALARIAGRTEKQDRLDSETADFHRLSIEGYRAYYEKYCPYPFARVDASLSQEEVYAQLQDILAPRLGR